MRARSYPVIQFAWSCCIYSTLVKDRALTKINSVGSFRMTPGRGAHVCSRVQGTIPGWLNQHVRALSIMCAGRAELLTSPIIPVTSPGIEPTVDFCESAVFYQRAINATRPCELNSWIQLFSSHGLVAFIARW